MTPQEALERLHDAGFPNASVTLKRQTFETPGKTLQNVGWLVEVGEWAEPYPKPRYAPSAGRRIAASTPEALAMVVTMLLGPHKVNLYEGDGQVWCRDYKAVGPHALREIADDLTQGLFGAEVTIEAGGLGYGLGYALEVTVGSVTAVVKPDGRCELIEGSNSTGLWVASVWAKNLKQAFRNAVEARPSARAEEEGDKAQPAEVADDDGGEP